MVVIACPTRIAAADHYVVRARHNLQVRLVVVASTVLRVPSLGSVIRRRLHLGIIRGRPHLKLARRAVVRADPLVLLRGRVLMLLLR